MILTLLGTELEQFKAQFEAPVFQAFSRVKILKKLYGDRKGSLFSLSSAMFIPKYVA